MDASIMTWIFRPLAIVIGLLMAFFSYKIYKNSIGASKGWFYMAIFGSSLFLWSFSATLFKMLNLFMPRIIFGIIFLMMMAIFVPLAYTKLIKDFKFDVPKWLTPKFSLFIVIVIYFTVLISNILSGEMLYSTNLFMRKLLSISHWTLGLVTIYALVPTFYLMKITKKLPWILAFVFCVIVAIGLNIGQYYNGCCWDAGALSTDKVCIGYDLDYTSVYPEVCYAGIAGIGKIYQLFLLVGIIIGDISFYKLWRSLDF
jgi:hypothetical protein